MLATNFRQTVDVAAWIDYCERLTDHTNRPRDMAPKLVAGDPRLLRELGTHLLKRRYRNFCCTGVLGFGETSHTPARIARIRRNLEWTTFPGLDRARFPSLYYAHHDHDHPHLHFAIFNFDVERRRRITSYFDWDDRERVRLLVQLTNDLEGLTDPSDPQFWRDFSPPKFASSKDYKARHAKLVADARRAASVPGVRTRDDVIEILAAMGWSLYRKHDDRLEFREAEQLRPIVLRGAVSRANWDGLLGKEARRKRHQAYAARRIDRVRETAAAYLAEYSKDALDNLLRHKGRPAPKTFETALRALVDGKLNLALGVFGDPAGPATAPTIRDPDLVEESQAIQLPDDHHDEPGMDFEP
jgi:hypothetical protein